MRRARRREAPRAVGARAVGAAPAQLRRVVGPSGAGAPSEVRVARARRAQVHAVAGPHDVAAPRRRGAARRRRARVRRGQHLPALARADERAPEGGRLVLAGEGRVAHAEAPAPRQPAPEAHDVAVAHGALVVAHHRVAHDEALVGGAQVQAADGRLEDDVVRLPHRRDREAEAARAAERDLGAVAERQRVAVVLCIWLRELRALRGERAHLVSTCLRAFCKFERAVGVTSGGGCRATTDLSQPVR